MNREAFIKATEKTKWATVEELMQSLDDAGYWDEPFELSVLVEQKKAHIRRMMRQLKDDDGWPLFANIVVQDKEGSPKHIYKQQALFKLEDYRQVVGYHVATAQYHIKMARGYRRHAHTRFGAHIQIPFDFMD